MCGIVIITGYVLLEHTQVSAHQINRRAKGLVTMIKIMKLACIIMIGILIIVFGGCSRDKEAEENSPTSTSASQSFLEQAYSMGYNDEMLQHLKSLDFSDEMIINVEDLHSDEIETQITSDGRYSLNGFWTSYNLLAYMYIKNMTTQEITVLPYLKNPFNSFKILDNQSMYACIVRITGDDTLPGIRFYHLEQASNPFVTWYLPEAAPNYQAELLEAIPLPDCQRIVAFWYQRPTDNNVEIANLQLTYQIAILDFEGNEVNLIDSDIELVTSDRYGGGIGYPRLEDNFLQSEGDRLFFTLGEEEYYLDVKTGQIT